jgi:hypothetical protein
LSDLEPLTSEDYGLLINYYKNKSQETEFNFLLLQINSKKELQQTVSQKTKEAILEMSEQYSQSLSTIEALRKSLKIVNDKHAELDRKYLKLKEKQNKGN